jgi:Sec-independent protein translocase protein TatA
MDILGVGGWELVAIFLIMLVVAGPKRMIQWSYTLGKYIAMLRKMWAETAQMLQKEFDQAGVDVQVPKDIPTRGDINREIARALTPVTKPIQDSMDAARTELNATKQLINPVEQPKTEAKPAEENPTPSSNGSFGTWSQNKDETP